MIYPLDTWRGFLVRVRAIFDRSALERRLREEVRFHLEIEARKASAEGLDAAAARRTARERFGNVETIKGLTREARGARSLELFMQDLRYGLRTLITNPGFTAVAVLTLGLGVGANTAIFSVVNGVLLKGLDYPEPERLVRMYEAGLDGSYSRNTTTPSNFYAWKSGSGSFESVAGFYYTSRIIDAGDQPQRVSGIGSIDSIFEVLEVQPLLGRTFAAAEDVPDGEPIVVLSYGAWQRYTGGRKDIVGSSLALSGVPHTVIGVMPPGFVFPTSGPEFWTTANLDAEFRTNTFEYFISVIARLRPEQTLDRAIAEVEPVMARQRELYPDENENVRIEIVPMHTAMVGGVQTRIWVLMGAVGFVLLIACANLANLLLSRATSRMAEIAVRQAMGASRSRVIRQLITESLLLSALGAAVGVAFGSGFLRLLLVLNQGNIPRTQEVQIDATVLLFTLAVATVAGLIFGSVPAMQMARQSPARVLREGSRGTAGRQWIRHGLVVTEIALALVLLVGAGLLIRSFDQLQKVDPGVPVERVLTFGTALTQSGYPETENVLAFYEEAIERIGNLPGVVSAAAINNLPTAGRGNSAWFNILDRPVPSGETPPWVRYRLVSPTYLEKMDYRLISGRLLDERDRTGATPTAVINETLVRQYWPDENPLGKQIMLGPLEPSVFPPMTIVGVIEDAQTVGIAAAVDPVLYFPHAVMPSFSSFSFMIRTAVEPSSIASAVRAEIRAMDPSLPLTNLRTMEEVVDSTLATQRSSMILLAVFAGVAMAMAAIGVFGVLSYSVTQRARELGIRMALGADAKKLRGLVVRQGLAQAAVGIGVGLVGAFALTRLMASMLFQVSPTDPLTLVAVAGVLAATAAAASYLPAVRATRLDPMVALRSE